jgi:protein-S-isoprenylcysteine O-methyltransferase Ste14
MMHGERHTARSFGSRGGWWVVAQVPVLLGAFFLPLWTGVGMLAWDSAGQWAGFALTAAGGVVSLVGLVTLGDALSPYPRPRDCSSLKQHGIYKLVRHPIYCGLMLGSIGWALWWGSVAGVAYGVVVFAFFDRKSVREEIWLREHHAGYAAYARRVKKFLPGIY